MTLWLHWLQALNQLRPAFTRTRTFLWFTAAVAGFAVRTEHLGVTSIVRALALEGRFYKKLLDMFHSSAVQVDRLAALWTRLALKLFRNPVRINGRLVLVGDGLKHAKHGKKMPAVKLLHQQSQSQTKPEYIMGHSLQAVSLLVHAASSIFAVPLTMRIHEGLVWSNRDTRTLLDKMLALIGLIDLKQAFYFVADAYYANGKMIRGLLRQGQHLLSRAKKNAVAYEAAPKTPNKRGRPTKYGNKVKLASLFSDPALFTQAPSPVYGEKDTVLKYLVQDLMWKPAGCLVRFVAVIHPSRGKILLLCTDISLSALDIIQVYGWRFKIELSFKQAVHTVGSFAYHFWMKSMTPLKRRNGNQHLHRKTEEYRKRIQRKIHAYHVFIQAGVVAQGLLQYLSVAFPQLVWDSFGSWLRTIRPGVPPSELVVATALRQKLPQFLLGNAQSNFFAKFIAKRQDPDQMTLFRLAA